MSSKAYFVAHREFMENVRTKSFWIGILAFPVILALSIVVPRWLEQAKNMHEYAVLDHSGFLAKAVEERSALPDLVKVFLEVRSRYLAKGEAGVADFPERLRGEAPKLAKATEDEVREALEKVQQQINLGMVLDLDESKIPAMYRGQLRELQQFVEEVRAWWLKLPAEEAARFGGAGKFERVPIDDKGEATEAELTRRLQTGELFAYFVIDKDPVDGPWAGRYVSNNWTDKALLDMFSRYASDEVRARRFKSERIDPTVVVRIQKPIEFEATKIGKDGKPEKATTTDRVRQWAPVAFVYFLWIAVFMAAQMLLTNTVEEKSNRLIEVLLSSVSPLQLMTGKVAGIAATGLTVVGFWVLCAWFGASYGPGLMGVKDLKFGSILTDPVLLGSFLVYFFFGYLLYAAILVAIGSVCNSLKEAQNLVQPVFILLMIPLLAMIPISKDPNGLLARVLSFVPPFTPFVMMNRAAGSPPLWEYLVTGALLIAATYYAFRGAARVFRIGILMTGKPPKLREILRWMRAPIGAVPVQKQI